MQSLHRVEKSPSSDGTGGITAGDLSAQSIMGLIPVCLPYRHVPPLEMTMLASAPPVISTVGAEWRNLLPLMVQEALRREISRLRASWERLPSAPYRHVPPLEMTMLASAPLVISTVAERSGEIPPLMVRAALRQEISRLRVSWARFPSAPHRHAAPLEITMVASAPLVISTVAERSGEISPL